MNTRLLVSALLSLSLVACAAPSKAKAVRQGAEGEALPSSITARRPIAETTGSTTSVVCYFTSGSDTKWQWGLNNNNSYYALNGNWAETPFTAEEKFFTSTGEADITTACTNAQNYYKMSGYTLLGIFAAKTAAGSNYPIVINDTVELYPAL